MEKILKQLRRKLFGLDEQEAAFLRAIADTNEQISNLQKSLDDLYHNYSRTLVEITGKQHPDTKISCVINDVPLQVPLGILRAYGHCLQMCPKSSLTYYVEDHCVSWLSQQLKAGDIFLDVGAAYGVISLPIASVVGNTGKVYAFEPARQTRNSLQALITNNHLDNITVVPKAIADQIGTAEFIEYSTDNPFSWAADTSTLAQDVNPNLENYSTYSVEITTIDEFVQEQNIKPQAIKIDIEGFELYSLHGASHTLKTLKPFLCIDIHEDVKTKQSALLGVQPLLESWGYECHMDEHTLFASPKG
ncbi:MAG: FkbM family methyltransferase [Snowella sp.]|jgi:FkbM family methyltransferase|nr:MAG: FkbM family methyltransferase [Snowella sp.]